MWSCTYSAARTVNAWNASKIILSNLGQCNSVIDAVDQIYDINTWHYYKLFNCYFIKHTHDSGTPSVNVSRQRENSLSPNPNSGCNLSHFGSTLADVTFHGRGLGLFPRSHFRAFVCVCVWASANRNVWKLHYTSVLDQVVLLPPWATFWLVGDWERCKKIHPRGFTVNSEISKMNRN